MPTQGSWSPKRKANEKNKHSPQLRCIHTLKGHHTEIVCVAFNVQARALPSEACANWFWLQGTHVATGSMDNTAKLWDALASAESASEAKSDPSSGGDRPSDRFSGWSLCPRLAKLSA